MEEEHVLADQPDGAAQVPQLNLTEVDAIERDRARLAVGENR